MNTTPYFKDMSDEDLRSAYRAERENLYRWSQLAGPGKGHPAARGTGRALRNVEIIEALARRRGIRLVVAS